MSADFHNLSRRLFLSDRLKNILRVAADALAVSFSKLAGILSTPQDLLHQHATSKNVPTDSDPALEYDAREMINNSNEEENDVPVNKCRAPVCEMCLESIIPNYPEVNAQVKPSIRSPCERSSSV